MKKLPKYVYLIAIAIMIAIMHYSYTNYAAYYPSLASFNANPEKYDGVKSENCGIVQEVNSNGFIIRGGTETVQVRTANPRYPKYGTVCVYGTYKKEGYIEAVFVRYNDYIFLKYLISSLSIIYVIYIFFSEWKITRKGFTPKRVK